MNKATAACGTPDINSWWTTQAYLTWGKLWTKPGQYTIDRATARSPWRWTHHTSEPFKYSRNYLLWTPFNPEELLLNINIQWLNKTKDMWNSVKHKCYLLLLLVTDVSYNTGASGEIILQLRKQWYMVILLFYVTSNTNSATYWLYYSMWPPVQTVLHVDYIILCDVLCN